MLFFTKRVKFSAAFKNAGVGTSASFSTGHHAATSQVFTDSLNGTHFPVPIPLLWVPVEPIVQLESESQMVVLSGISAHVLCVWFTVMIMLVMMKSEFSS